MGIKVHFLGFVKDSSGNVATVAAAAAAAPKDGPIPPIVAVSGTCMAAGKTRAACEIIHELTAGGRRIHGAKVTGVACLRDLLVMQDHGAHRTSSFLDFGLVSTVGIAKIDRYGRMVLRHLGSDSPDLVILELSLYVQNLKIRGKGCIWCELKRPRFISPP